ncbi:MAG: M24 family metallopeptidase, partial [Bacteroidetes bacterium]
MSLTAAMLARLREEMAHLGLFAYVLPRTDPHQSEYLAPHWETLAWLTGFTGSAGTAVVTADFAGVWTDSRYFLQAETQLEGSGYTLVKLGVPHTPEFIDWLAENCPEGSRVGIDFALISVSRMSQLQERLEPLGITLEDTDELAARLWESRPPLPTAPVRLFPVERAGLSRDDKLGLLREDMAQQKVDYVLLSALDEIAWLANLRGADIPYNPVAVAYALIGQETATLFVAPDKLTADMRAALTADGGWHTLPYEQFMPHLAGLPAGSRVHLDPARTAYALRQALPEGVQVRKGLNLTAPRKARKHVVEIEHIRRTMIKDGVAMVRFLYWLSRNIGEIRITELSAEAKLEAFRREQPGYVGPSFRTIAGYQGHGAIVHYAASEESNAELRPEGIFLLDSGGQYE